MTELMTAEAGTVEATPGRRIPLPILLAPFAVAAAGGMVADWVWPSLISHHPIVLLTLSSKNRFLLLVAPQVGVIAFFVVGFFRLIFTDPVTYLLGRQYGENALSWVERKTSRAEKGQSFIRKAERLFGRYGPLVIVIAPSALWCVLAGAARMKVWVFVSCNIVGTIGRLVLFWLAADALHDQLQGVLDGIERFQFPLLALTVGLGVVHTLRNRRRRVADAA